MKPEHKTVSFEIKEVDEETGVFTGYAATFSKKPDSYGDIIEPGAFAKTLKEAGNRVKILWNHNTLEPIGKPDELLEDDKGLLVKGKLSLGVQRAKEVLSLMKDGVITEMSIGYDTLKESWQDGIRHLQEVRLWDVSPVTFAANPEAIVLSVKKATTFADLPLADREDEWDASAAEKRVRAWAGGEDNINWNKYRQAFYWYDEESPELFGSYKLGFADVAGSKLTAIPRGIFAVAAVIMGARGGVQIPEADMAKVKTHVEKYYTKMQKEFDDEEIIAPWNKAETFNCECVECGHELISEKHCSDIKCPECGGEMRRAERPGPGKEKAGRVLSATNLAKVQAALAALQALLEAAISESEPEKSTQLAEATKEAAELEIVVASLKAENDGFDVKVAERRIEAILETINKKQEVK